MHFRGSQKQRAMLLCAETGSRCSANQPEAIAWGLSLFLFLQFISFPPQTLPIQMSKAAGGDFSVHKSVWFIERAHVSQPFNLLQTIPPGEADGDSISNAGWKSGGTSKPDTRRGRSGKRGFMPESCSVSGMIKRHSRGRIQGAGRQDGHEELECSLEHVSCRHFSSRDLA